jgi:hypothetical protein
MKDEPKMESFETFHETLLKRKNLIHEKSSRITSNNYTENINKSKKHKKIR